MKLKIIIIFFLQRVNDKGEDSNLRPYDILSGSLSAKPLSTFEIYYYLCVIITYLI